MAHSTATAQGPSETVQGPYPLEPGDRLSRDEFERRYGAMPHLKKAELLKGIVCMPAPVRLRRHGEPHSRLVTWLGVYQAHTPGLRSGDNTTVRLGPESEPQPDALLILPEGAGGQSRVGPDDYLEGAPELVAEVASSTASYDLHVKLEVYQEHGVREYVVWRVLDGQIDWFVLRDGQYERLEPGDDGVLRSQVLSRPPARSRSHRSGRRGARACRPAGGDRVPGARRLLRGPRPGRRVAPIPSPRSPRIDRKPSRARVICRTAARAARPGRGGAQVGASSLW